MDSSANLATTYLEGSFAIVGRNIYDLSLVTYALTLAGSLRVDMFQNAFEALATVEGRNAVYYEN